MRRAFLACLCISAVTLYFMYMPVTNMATREKVYEHSLGPGEPMLSLSAEPVNVSGEIREWITALIGMLNFGMFAATWISERKARHKHKRRYHAAQARVI